MGLAFWSKKKKKNRLCSLILLFDSSAFGASTFCKYVPRLQKFALYVVMSRGEKDKQRYHLFLLSSLSHVSLLNAADKQHLQYKRTYFAPQRENNFYMPLTMLSEILHLKSFEEHSLTHTHTKPEPSNNQ